MTDCTQPPFPLPEPLRGIEPDTFAHDSIVVRLPEIARQMIADNHFSPEVLTRLETLIREIPDGPIRGLQDPRAPDADQWSEYISPYLDHNWLEVPWFFVENYFYRRILEATGYFQPGPGQGVDPYEAQKRMGLETSRETIAALCARLSDQLQAENLSIPETLIDWLTIDLRGNQNDLSLWPAGANSSRHAPAQLSHETILIDQSPAIAQALIHPEHPLARVDWLLDNAGFELVCDLALADFMLSKKIVQQVALQVKAYPTFVSDALIKDLLSTISFLGTQENQPCIDLARRLYTHLDERRLLTSDHAFWNSPLPQWQMPADLRASLSQADLILAKGDAHYRRLLGDLHWPYTTPFKEVVCYPPRPVAALRALKSEIIVGLKSGQAEQMQTRDPHWLSDGHWGIIQSTL